MHLKPIANSNPNLNSLLHPSSLLGAPVVAHVAALGRHLVPMIRLVEGLPVLQGPLKAIRQHVCVHGS
jgi:hypothetical protein